jgi:rubrerythrin
MGKRTPGPSDVDGGAAPRSGAAPSAAGSGPEVVPLQDPASRRRFLALVGGAGAAAALTTLVSACGGETTQPSRDVGASPQPNSDLEVANYALYLEYLEEDFYKRVVDSGQLRSEYQTLAKQIRLNETEHAQALEALVEQLGGTPVPRPVPNFDAVIQAGEQRIIDTAATVENLGAAAYLGQATNIENNLVLEAALTIHTVEARHAAALNEIAGNGFRGGGPLTGSVPDGAFGEPMTREQVLAEAAPFVKA